MFFQRLAINGNLLTFAFVLSVMAPVLFGVVPALQSSQPNLNEDLKEGGRDASSSVRGNRSRAVLVVAQVAFALAVLIVSGLDRAHRHRPRTRPARHEPRRHADDARALRSAEVRRRGRAAQDAWSRCSIGWRPCRA